MNKKERYINYVVGDLVKNTEIDHDKKRIKYPFLKSTYFLSSHPPHLTHPTYPLFKYLKERYGARDEEVKIIFNHYKERIEILFSNE